MRKWTVFVLVLMVIAALAFARPLNQRGRTDAVIEVPVRQPGWLHVEVETSWGWFWQKSQGRAWVTESKEDTLPMEVGKICIRLSAHGTTQKCDYGKSEIAVNEKKWGVQIAKRTAIVTAWTNQPDLEAITVQMEP